MELRILILEDEAADAQLMEREFKKTGMRFVSERVENREQFTKAIEQFSPDIILADYKLPAYDGLSALAFCRERLPEIPFIFVSGAIGEEQAIETLKKGATDYVFKNRLSKLVPAVQRALKEKRERTQRQKAQRLLRESEQRLRNFFENEPNYCYMISHKGTILDINKAALKTLEYARDETVGKSFMMIYAPESAPKASRIFEEWKKTGKIRNEELTIISKTGKKRNVLLNASSVRNSDGEILHSISVQIDITERKLNEEIIAKSEAKYRSLVENIATGVATTDIRGRFTYVNEALCKMIGYSSEELLGKPFARFLHPADRKRILKVFASAWKNPKRRVSLEFRVHRKNGKTIHLFSSPTLTLFKDKILGFNALIFDMTARKQMEEALKESEAKFRMLAENYPDVIYRFDKDHRYLYANPAVRAIDGFPPQHYLGKIIWDFAYPEDECRYWQEMGNKVFRTAKPLKGIADVQGPEGRRYVSWHMVPEFDSTGNVRSILSTERDITEIKVSEEKANRLLKQQVIVNKLALEMGKKRELNEIYNIIYNHVKHLMDTEAFVVSFLDKKAKLIHAGYVISEGEIRDVSKFPPIPLERKGRGTQSKVIRSGKPLNLGDWRESMKKTNKEYLITANASLAEGTPPPEKQGNPTNSGLLVPLKIEGETIGVIQVQSHRLNAYTQDDADLLSGIANMAAIAIQNARLYEEIQRELMERKRAEEERQKIEEQLIRAQKMEAIGTLAGGIAHDFNNLLTAISGYGEFALKQVEPNSPVADDIRQMHSISQKAMILTRQLLAFSRRQVMRTESINLNEVVTNIRKMLHRIIGENIELTTELDLSLKSANADVGQIEQVIVNMVVNACDAMQQGGKLILKTDNVTIDEDYPRTNPDAYPGNFVLLTIQDSGTGISHDALQHIFEPFFSTKTEQKGTGLGLSVAYGIIKQHKGWITVYSEQGTGTMFRIYLPMIEKPDCKHIPLRHPKSLKGNGECVLIVEDDRNILNFAKRALLDNGYIPIAVQSAREARRVFSDANVNIQVLFCDIVLKDANGFELARQLYSQRSTLKVLLTSGYIAHKTSNANTETSDFLFIQKPYVLNTLLTALRQAIEKG
jgi:PAS domain S-box-containing protein